MRYKATGRFTIYATFEDDRHVEFSFEGATFIFPLVAKKDCRQEFEFCFEANSGEENIKAQKLKDIFANLVQFGLNVLIEDINIGRIQQRGSNISLNQVTHKVDYAVAKHYPVSGSSINKDQEIDLLKKISSQIRQEDMFLLKLYGQSFAADSYSSFWYIYLILSITIGERKKIDEEIKRLFPQVPTVYSDHEQKEVTKFVAIRDSFSHKSTFNGLELNIESELKIHFSTFREIAHKFIKDKITSNTR